MKRLIMVIAIICVGISQVGCEKDSNTQNSVDKTELQDSSIVNVKVKNITELTAILEKAGYKIKATKQDNEGFLTGTLTLITIDGDSIGVYEYEDSEKMEQDAQTIKSDGSMIGTKVYDWKSKPHFYKNGSVIVSYFGENKETIKKIEDLIGQQFAGVI
jgi:hypothetical protein